MISRINRRLLRQMRVGESRLFSEPESTKNAGTYCQSTAVKIGIRIATKQCFLVIPHDNTMVRSVCVTVLGEK